MDKIKVEICCGTTCYLLGAGKLLALESELPAPWRPRVEFVAIPCLERCERENLGQAPFARVAGRIIANANAERLLNELSALLEADHE